MIFRTSLFICLFFTFFYAGILDVRVSTDAVATTMLPISLIRKQSFDLVNVSPTISKYIPSKIGKNGLPYYIINKNGHQLSVFPVFSSIIAVPIYFFPVILYNINLENLAEHFDFVLLLGKISASFFSAVSVTFVFLSLRELLNYKKTLLLTVLYALGTSTLSISSQYLWQHAASQMFLSISAYFFLKSQRQKSMLAYCGLFLSFATLSRFPNLIIFLLFFVYILVFERKNTFIFLKFILPSLIFVIWYQLTYAGDLFFYKYESLGEIANFNNNFLVGFLGLLIAPSKGLFVYSPFFIFSIWGAFIAWKEKTKQLIFFSIISLTYIAFIAKWSAWHGSVSFGPRMLADITPFLTILIAPVINKSRIFNNIKFKQVFFFTAALSIFIHFLGASFEDFTYIPRPWNWDYPEIIYYYLKAGGFFGVINNYFQQLIHISMTVIIGFSTLIILYIAIRYLKEKISRTLKLTAKL